MTAGRLRGPEPGPRRPLGDQVISIIADGGHGPVFGIPGSHTLGLYEALGRSTVAHVTGRHEQGVGFMADGASRSTGRTAVCSVITGPGVTNVATAVAQAHSDAVPVLVLAGDVTTAQREGPGGHSHQLRDQDAVVRSISQRSVQATTPEHVLRGVSDALRPTASARPGPVVVQVPEDLWGDHCLLPDLAEEPARVDEEELDAVLGLMITAQRPLLVLGGGAMGASSNARELAELWDAPVLTSLNGKGAIPAHHRLHAGVITQQSGVPRGAAQDLLEEADVILAVGTELGPTDFWCEMPRLTGVLIHLDVDAAVPQRHLRSRPWIGEADTTLGAALAGWPRTGRPSAARSGADRAAACRSRLLREAGDLGKPFVDWVAALRQALPDDGCLATDSTSFNYYGTTPYFEVRCPRGWLNPSGLGTLGYAVPAAIGAAVAEPQRAVVAVAGDGGFLFTAQELIVAAELDLPVVTVVWDNQGFGEIARLLDEVGAPPVGCHLPRPDYAALARAFGAHHAVAGTPQDLARQVEAGLAATGPTLVVVPA